MSVERLVAAHYRRQQALARRAARAVARLWSRVDRGNIAASWRELLGPATAVVSTAQGTAATGSGLYVDRVADELDAAGDPAGRIRPLAFAGVASDGRPLGTLLNQPAIKALQALSDGADIRRAMNTGLLELDMIVRTQVADAGRVADGAAITARPELTGYVRMVAGGSCARCLILAGRRYVWNAGFQRHPRCDCRHIPVAEDADDVRTNPRAAFDAMTADEQDRVFTRAGADAIRAGADMNRVVNSRRGMYTAAGRKFTREATTRRGVGRTRLMPEQIYIEAGGNRDEAIRLLRLHGYIT